MVSKKLLLLGLVFTLCSPAYAQLSGDGIEDDPLDLEEGAIEECLTINIYTGPDGNSNVDILRCDSLSIRDCTVTITSPTTRRRTTAYLPVQRYGGGGVLTKVCSAVEDAFMTCVDVIDIWGTGDDREASLRCQTSYERLSILAAGSSETQTLVVSWPFVGIDLPIPSYSHAELWGENFGDVGCDQTPYGGLCRAAPEAVEVGGNSGSGGNGGPSVSVSVSCEMSDGSTHSASENIAICN